MNQTDLNGSFGVFAEFSYRGNASYPFNVPHEEEQIFLLIIDEASMVSSEMLKILLKTQKEFGFNILFACDRCQIPPIGEDISPVFTIKKARHLKLTRNMRSEVSKDSDAVAEYRKYTDTPSVKPGISMLSKISKNKMITLFESSIVPSENEKEEDQDCIVLVYTNAKRIKWNSYIRSLLFKDKDEIEPYYEGEKLVFTGRRDNECIGLYNTSSIVEIVELKKVEKQISRSTKAGRACQDFEVLDISFYQITDQRGTLWFVVLEQDKIRLDDFFYRYKKAIIALDPKVRGRYWKGYYELLNLYTPNLDYTYASTVHKAQGSQWKNVIVDFGNLMQCRDNVLRNKLIYTAVSRMTDRVFYSM